MIITFGPHYEDVFGWLGGSLGSVKRRAKQQSHVRPLMRGMPKYYLVLGLAMLHDNCTLSKEKSGDVLHLKCWEKQKYYWKNS